LAIDQEGEDPPIEAKCKIALMPLPFVVKIPQERRRSPAFFTGEYPEVLDEPTFLAKMKNPFS
jgi:hypothetical protein